MNSYVDFSKKLKFMKFIFYFARGLLFRLNPFLLELIYFTTLSSLGFLALKSTKPRTPTTNNTDLIFTSVSAATVSSMSVVEMEVFSNTQLLFLTAIMLMGGEVFTSMLGLALQYFKRPSQKQRTSRPPSHPNHTCNNKPIIKTLIHLVSCYLLVVHAVGLVLVSIYFTVAPGAKRVLEKKGIKLSTFSIFTTVSTVSNCGFLPTNENMVVFKNNPGLMLILIPQILMGNTMYPVFLRLSIWFMGKVTRRAEFTYMLESSKKLGYRGHLIPGMETVYLGMSVLGLIVVQMVSLCVMEWNNQGLGGGLDVYEKVVGFLFEAVNARNSGLSAFDLSVFSPAILVMFVLMMYLPPYTSYLPISTKEENTTREQARFWDYILFSRQTYLFIFIFLICITERHEMKTDPLNFNVLSIVFEVISAHGNVGFSVGYSCQRRINHDGHCKDVWYGFSGKWSDEGKFLLVTVMFIGRLKKFDKRGGRAWSLP